MHNKEGIDIIIGCLSSIYALSKVTIGYQLQIGDVLVSRGVCCKGVVIIAPKEWSNMVYSSIESLPNQKSAQVSKE